MKKMFRLKKLKTFMAAVLLLTLINNSLVWSASYAITGNDDWTSQGNKSFSGNPGSGITLSNPADSGTITVDAHINTDSNNGFGTFVTLGGNASFVNTGVSSSNTFTSSGNTQEGFYSGGANSKLSIDNMNVTAENNSNGVYIMNGGVFDLTGNGMQQLQVNNNNTTGIFANNTGSTLNVTDMDVNISGHVNHGLEANNGSIINIINTGSSSQNLNVSGNSNTGFTIDRNSSLTVKNMEVSFTGNGTGLRVNSGTADFEGRGTETFSSSQNTGKGVIVETGSDLSITDMNVDLSDNVNNNGLEILGGSSVNIINNGSGALQLQVNGNGDKGAYMSNSSLTVKNMDVSFSSNTGSGLEVRYGSTVDFEGTGTENFEASYNGNKGVMVNDSSQLNITDMNATFSNNTDSGLEAGGGSTVVIKGDGLKFEANDNGAKGITASGTNTSVTIEDMDVSVNDNKGSGIYGDSGSSISIKGDGNLLQVNGNGATGGWPTGGIVMNNGSIEIEGMNVEIKDTAADSGLWTVYGGKISIEGDGANTLEISGGTGRGIYSDNVSGSTASTIDILGMDVTIKNNGSYAIDASGGGAVNITGTAAGGNLLELSGNSRGVSVNGTVNGISSAVNVTDMNVIIDGITDYGIYVNGGGKANIKSSDGANTLDIDGGITAVQVNGVNGSVRSELNIENTDITVKNNTDNAFLITDGGSVNITSFDGTNTLDIDGGKAAIQVNGENSGFRSTLNIEEIDITIKNTADYGIFVENGGAGRIKSADGTNTLNISNSGNSVRVDGITNGFQSRLDIEDMNITIENGTSDALAVNNGGFANIISNTKNHTLRITDTDGIGIYVNGDTGGTKSALNIEDMDVIVRNSTDSGVAVTGAIANIKSSTGNHSFEILNSTNSGVYTNAGNIYIEDMNVNVSDNGTGFYIQNGSVANIKSSNGIHTLKANNNTGLPDSGGIKVTGSTLTVRNMDVEVNHNGFYGLELTSGAYVVIASTIGAKTFEANNNIGDPANSKGVYLAEESALELHDYDISINGNGAHGLLVDSGSVFYAESTTGNNTFEANNNLGSATGKGVHVAGVSGSGGSSTLIIQDMNVEMNNNGEQGLFIDNGGQAIIFSTLNNNHTFEANGNAGTTDSKGIQVLGVNGYVPSTLVIQNMDVSANDNGGSGISSGSGGSIYINSDGSKFLQANNNKNASAGWTYGVGITADNVSAGIASTVTIEDMDVEAKDNGQFGIRAEGGGQVNITGTGNTLTVSGNKSTDINGWPYGAGIYSRGSDPIGASAINISGAMDIYVNDNGLLGLAARDGGVINIVSAKSGGNTLESVGNINDDGSKGTGMLVEGVSNGDSSEIYIENMNVLVKDNAESGIAVSDGASMTVRSLTGANTLKANNNKNSFNDAWNSGNGITASGSNGSINSTINMSKMNIEANDNGSYGIVAQQGAVINIAGDGNTLDIYDNGLFGLAAKDNSMITVTDMIINGSTLDNALIGAERDGVINFTDSAITSENASLFSVWNETGETAKITLTNSTAIGEGTSLLISGAEDAIFEAVDSYLENAIVTDPGKNLKVSVTDTHWLMKNSSNMTELTATSSVIDLRKNNGYNSLTLNKLDSTNTSYLLNTYFDIGGQNTDKIIVDGGDATGLNNDLHILSTGYDGSYKSNGYGIQIVNLDTATDKSVEFNLLGGIVDSGAYEYEFYQAADDNYYLQSNHKATTIAKTISNLPAIHLSIVKTGMDELTKRIGELRSDTGHGDGLWFHTHAKSLEVDDNIDSKMNLYGAEAGYDKRISDSGKNIIYAGIMGGYLYTDKIELRNLNHYSGESSANTPSAGIYAAWINDNGWFADVSGRYFWSMMDITNYTAAGDLINYDSDRNFITAALEFGKRFDFELRNEAKVTLEPKAEVQYAFADSETFTTNTNNKVHYDQTNSLNTRIAMNFGYNHDTKNGRVIKPFAEVGISNEWLGETDIRYAGGDFKSDLSGISYDFAVGLSVPVANNWTISGDIAYETGNAHEGIGANLGFRFGW